MTGQEWPLSAIVTVLALITLLFVVGASFGRVEDEREEFKVRLSVCEGKPAVSAFEAQQR